MFNLVQFYERYVYTIHSETEWIYNTGTFLTDMCTLSLLIDLIGVFLFVCLIHLYRTYDKCIMVR